MGGRAGHLGDNRPNRRLLQLRVDRSGRTQARHTDEAKAIALFQFFRQRVYHYLNLPESREPLKTVNIMGNTLCGSQATCMKGLLEDCAGLKTRVVSHPGHTFYEVWYDDKWHGFDTMTNFYVFTRGDKRSVASFAELRQDPTLIQDAIKDGRATPNMCCCGDEAKNFAQKIQVIGYTPATSKWSVKDGRLRLGEEMVRSWWPEGKPLPGSHAKNNLGPLHTCGTRDRRAEPFLYKFWEPYGLEKFGGTTVSYRHYFNGQLNYAPDLTNREAVLDGGNKLNGASDREGSSRTRNLRVNDAPVPSISRELCCMWTPPVRERATVSMWR